MKKVFVLILALMMVGFVFAEEAKPAYDVVADATVTWGYDVETGATGFTNEMNFELTFPLVAGATAEAKGENVYGQITITGINLALYNDGTDAKVFDNYDEDGFYDTFEAKIVAGPMYVIIDSAPDFELNNANVIGPVAEHDDYEDYSILANTAADKTLGGLTVGYKNDMIDFGLQIASNGNWTGADAVTGTAVYTATRATVGYTEAAAIAAGLYIAPGIAWAAGDGAIAIGDIYYVRTFTGAEAAEAKNEKNNYILGFTASITPIEMLTIDVAGFMDAWSGANKGLTFGLTLTPVEALEVTANMDASIVGSADMIWDAAFGTTYTLANADEVALNAFFAPADSIGTVNAYLEAGISFTEDGAEGFVPALGASAYFKAYDLLNSTDTTATEGIGGFVGGTLDYTFTVAEGKTVKPYAAMDLGLLHLKSGADLNGLAYTVGVEAAVIANTTITAEFAAGDIADDMGTWNTITKAGEPGTKGIFTLACTIEL